MAQRKQKPLDDSEIMVRVNQAVKEGVGWYDSKISKERERVIQYYNGTYPKRRSLGSSSYVSTDVYDSVEAMKSQIVETFAANPDNLVSFPPLGPQDVESSKEATEYCNHVFFNDNDGLGIIHDVTHDGLTARVGIAKVYWDEYYETIEEHFSGISYLDVQSLAAQPDIDLEADADPDSPDPLNPLFSGKISRRVDNSCVRVEVIAPEEFIVEPRSRTIKGAGLSSHRTLKTKAQLIEMGYDRNKVMALHYDDNKGLDLSPEVLAREQPVESLQALDDPIQPETEKVMLYESYVRMDLHDGKGVRLYKIVHVNDVLLEKAEVDCPPFKAFIPLPVSHMFFGNNFAHRVIPVQNARTVLTRGILDHTAVTTNPRWTVLKGGLINPREMLDNRLGGIVNINRPDAVEPLAQQSLNPFVFQTLEMLKANKEESTGISALSQGLNKDAISTQNSAALVDNLVNLSTQRQKIIARNFAKFLADVYVEIYRLALENQDKSRNKIIKIAGDFVPVSTRDWIERTTCHVALHLGYGERDRESAKYSALYEKLSAGAGPLFTGQNRYNLIVDGMKASGFENYANYITAPDKVASPKPDPIKAGEVAAKNKSASAALLTAQSKAAKNEKDSELALLKEQLAELQERVKTVLAIRDADRKDADVANRIYVSRRELEQAQEANGKELDIVSPSG